MIFDTLESALGALQNGRAIVVVDDADRENEGDLVVPAHSVTADQINHMARNARGLICVAMTGESLDRLGVSMMVPGHRDGSPYASPFTVSVEAAHGVTTGISTADRATTARILADPASTGADLKMPGHVFPLRAHPDGVLARRGHTEASVDLMRLAGAQPAAVICEIMDEDGTMARAEALKRFAARHGHPIVSVDMVARHVASLKPAQVERIAEAVLPTSFGPFRAIAYRDAQGLEHLLLRYETDRGGSTGEAEEKSADSPADRGPVVRLHSECLTGDVLGSLRCDCGDQLKQAMRRITDEGAGILVYLRQEGRGIGLANKIRAYALQDGGMDTVEANQCLGFSADHREYATAAAMLRDQGIGAVRLMTNNPAKIEGLETWGIEVSERLPVLTPVRPDNRRYLETKALKLDHQLGEPTPAAR